MRSGSEKQCARSRTKNGTRAIDASRNERYFENLDHAELDAGASLPTSVGSVGRLRESVPSWTSSSGESSNIPLAFSARRSLFCAAFSALLALRWRFSASRMRLRTEGLFFFAMQDPLCARRRLNGLQSVVDNTAGVGCHRQPTPLALISDNA